MNTRKFISNADHSVLNSPVCSTQIRSIITRTTAKSRYERGIKKHTSYLHFELLVWGRGRGVRDVASDGLSSIRILGAVFCSRKTILSCLLKIALIHLFIRGCWEQSSCSRSEDDVILNAVSRNSLLCPELSLFFESKLHTSFMSSTI